ncbi:MAG: GGDEF domain-containing protein [Nitrospirae bacterium]|nr:GGDEF domain-containing protein [Nitrospirota bacterium]
MSDKEISRWRSLASVIAEFRVKAGSRLQLNELAAFYAGELSRIFDSAACILFLGHDDATSLLVSAGVQGALRESEYQTDMPLLRHLSLTRKGFFWGPDQCRTSDFFPGEKPHSLLCSPVIVRDVVSGFFSLSSSEKDIFGPEDLAMAELLSGELATVMEISSLQLTLDAVSVTDPLTGCYNAKKFNDDIEVDIPCSERYGRPLSLVKIDIDFMQHYNEAFGRVSGDQLIRKVGETLSYSIRMCDRLYRFGGEEFILILPGIDKERGVFAAQRLQKALGQLRFEGESDSQPGGMITYSIGVASFPVDAVFKDGLMKKLDAALLRSKESGGNAVVSP